MKAVVVLPTYNERENIGPLIAALQAAFQRTLHDCAILVVDDNSPDGTGEVVRDLQRDQPNLFLLSDEKQGLGVAYARGIDHALRAMAADAVVHMDADYSHDPADVPRLLAKIDEGYDVAVGTRYMEGGGLPADWGWHRRLISRLANVGARVIAGLTALHDCTNGYRAYRASVLRDVDLASAPRGYAVLTFLAYHALLRGRVAEVPIVFSQRARGTSKLRPGDVIEFFLNVWWIRYDRRERFFRYATGGLSSVAANLGAIALLHHGLGVAPLPASALAIEASVLFSIGWRRVWGRALGRRSGGALWRFAGRTHLLAVPSSLLTFGVFVAATGGGVPVVAAQALGIVPALIWNYFIGDRGLDLLRRLRADRPPAATGTAAPIDRAADGF